LRFVVEQTLAGQGDRLKGYTIAVEVFDRPPDFDAQSDPLVRVEAGRLRRRLIEYYAEEGRGNPVRIELPRGGYTVAYSYRVRNGGASAVLLGPMPPGVPAESAESDAARNRRAWRRLRAALVAAVILAGLGVIVLQQVEVSRLARVPATPTPAVVRDDRKPPIVVMPFDDLSGGNLAELAATLTEEILLLLGEREIFVVTTQAGGAAANEGTAYVLRGSVRDTPAQVRITARLVNAATGTQIWSAAYDEPRGILSQHADQARVARLIATVARPYGPIFDAELERARAVPAADLSTRDCLLKYYDYRRRLDGMRHGEAMACFEVATVREPNDASAWAGLSLMTVDSFAHGYASDGVDAFERPREAARRAMDIDGDNLLANLALVDVQYFSGADFRPAAERVLRTWPNNGEALSFIGSAFVLTGETARGRALVDRAIESTPRAPSGYYASRALAAIREQRFEDALEAALGIDSPDWPLGQLIVATTAALAGRADLAMRARARLLEFDATIETSLPEVLRRWRVEPVLAEELRRGLAAAGG
jgi:adenylate cyclase